jgi:tripartite-type tricarboxylate transporter receptor subunit TctC
MLKNLAFGCMITILGFLGALMAPDPASAASPEGKKDMENFPIRPLSVMVPFPPGSNVAQMAAVLAPYMENELGQKVTVTPKPGGGGTAGITWLTQAVPDGYNLGYTPPRPITVSPLVSKQSYTRNDLIPVAQVGVFYTALVVPENSKWKTVREFLEDARKNPNGFSYGTGGQYSLAHLAMEAFTQAAGVQTKHIAFAASPEAVKGMLAGKVDLSMTDLRSEFGKDGKTRVLAIATGARLQEWPEVPTLKELGFDLTFDVWQGLIAPKNTPPAVVMTLEKAVQKITTLPAFREEVKAKTGAEVAFLGSREWSAKWDREEELFHKVLHKLGALSSDQGK